MNIGYFVNGYTYEFNLYVKMFTFECSFQKYKAFLRAMRFVTFHQFVHSDLEGVKCLANGIWFTYLDLNGYHLFMNAKSFNVPSLCQCLVCHVIMHQSAVLHIISIAEDK